MKSLYRTLRTEIVTKINSWLIENTQGLITAEKMQLIMDEVVGITDELIGKTPVKHASYHFTSNKTLSSLVTGAVVDTVTLQEYDIILLSGQTSMSDNGVWEIKTGSDPVRPKNFDTAEKRNGILVMVQNLIDVQTDRLFQVLQVGSAITITQFWQTIPIEQANYRGTVTTASAALTGVENGHWVRCTDNGVYTNFSGVSANAQYLLAYNGTSSLWEVVPAGAMANLILTSSLDANGEKIINLGIDEIEPKTAINHAVLVYSELLGTTVYNADTESNVLRARVENADKGYVYAIQRIYWNHVTEDDRIIIYKIKLSDLSEVVCAGNTAMVLGAVAGVNEIVFDSISGFDERFVMTINYDGVILTDGGLIGSSGRMIFNPNNYIYFAEAVQLIKDETDVLDPTINTQLVFSELIGFDIADFSSDIEAVVYRGSVIGAETGYVYAIQAIYHTPSAELSRIIIWKVKLSDLSEVKIVDTQAVVLGTTDIEEVVIESSVLYNEVFVLTIDYAAITLAGGQVGNSSRRMVLTPLNYTYISASASSFDQDLNTTDDVVFASVEAAVINMTGTIPTGTLAVPPAGLAIGDQWADTTDSATHPIIRIKVA